MFRFASSVSILLSPIIGTAVLGSPLQPSDKWVVDYGNTQCTAARSFNSPAGQTVLGIVPALSGSSYRLLVSVERTGPAFAKEREGAVDFGRGAIHQRVLYYGGTGVKLTVYQYRVSASDLEEGSSGGEVRLWSDGGEHYTFALSNMPAVLNALRECNSDLQRLWNMSGTPEPSIVDAPAGDVRSLFTRSDYSTEAVSQSEQGSTQYQLLIDERGAVARCDVLASSRDPSLDATGCDIIRERAKFRPALDARGNAIRSVFTALPVTWRLPDLTTLDCVTMHESSRRPGVSSCGEQTPRPMPILVTTPAKTPHGQSK